MKKWIVILVALALAVPAARADDTTPPSALPDDTTAEHQGYTPDRYSDLWTKSPFAVETPDQTVTESADYSLVGIAQIEGVTYASLIQKQNNNHLLVSSDKPLGDLTLNSVTKKDDGTYATLTRNGELLTLKLEVAQVGAPGLSPTNPPPSMTNAGMQNGGVMPQNMPGASPFTRPFIRIRRPLIHVPPAPGQPNPPPGAQP